MEWIDISSTLKGSNKPAQGNALGCLKYPISVRSGESRPPLGSRPKPLCGMVFWIAAVTQGVVLG